MKLPAHGHLFSAALALVLAGTAGIAQESGTSGIAAPEPTEAPASEATDTEAQSTPNNVAPEEPDTEATGSPDATVTAPAPEQEPLEVVKATYGDWEVRCAADETDCFMYQLALDSENNPVAEFSLVRLAGGSDAAAGATVVTPLGTLLPAGVELQVDEGEVRRYAFTWCSQVGCFARFGVDEASVAAMKSGQVAKAVLVSVAAPDRPLLLEVSLSGFTAAFDSLEPGPAEPN